jgi:non-homologous end joining protein Ku
MRLIKAKLKGKTPRLKERELPKQAEVIDLMARLQASLEGRGRKGAAAKGRAGGARKAAAASKPAAARRADARKRRVA